MDKEKQIDNSWRAKMVENGIYKDAETTSEEKHIEEMAKVMCGGCYDGTECQHGLCSHWYNAEKLYEQGYRKIPKDSVVLTKEEYDKYQNLKRDVEHSFEYNQGYTDGQTKGSKETAYKIYRELQGHGTTYVKKWIKEQFGVDIKE